MQNLGLGMKSLQSVKTATKEFLSEYLCELGFAEI